jgi:hypothetical protein
MSDQQPTEPGPLETPAPREAPARPAAIRGARRAAVIALIVSISITAVIGIVVLLTGAFGETQGRVLLTTLLIAGFSTVALCHLAVAGRPVRIVGFVGLGVSAISLLLGLILIWMPWTSALSEALGGIGRWFGVTGIVALTLAQANLLLLLAGRRHLLVRIAMAVTLTALGVVALMLVLPILSEGSIPGYEQGDAYWRGFGVVAIVDALGTVALPIVGLLVRDRPAAVLQTAPEAPAAAPAAAPAPVSDPVRLALDARIDALAASTGLDRAALLTAALDAFESARTGGRPQ